MTFLDVVICLCAVFLLGRFVFVFIDLVQSYPDVAAVLSAFVAAVVITALVISYWASMPWRDR